MKTNLILCLTVLMMILVGCAKDEFEPNFEAVSAMNNEFNNNINRIPTASEPADQADFPFLIQVEKGSRPFWSSELFATIDLNVIPNPEYDGEIDQHFGVTWEFFGQYSNSGIPSPFEQVQTGDEGWAFILEEPVWSHMNLDFLNVTVTIQYYNDNESDCGSTCSNSTSFCLENVSNDESDANWVIDSDCSWSSVSFNCSNCETLIPANYTPIYVNSYSEYPGFFSAGFGESAGASSFAENTPTNTQFAFNYNKMPQYSGPLYLPCRNLSSCNYNNFISYRYKKFDKITGAFVEEIDLPSFDGETAPSFNNQTDLLDSDGSIISTITGEVIPGSAAVIDVDVAFSYEVFFTIYYFGAPLSESDFEVSPNMFKNGTTKIEYSCFVSLNDSGQWEMLSTPNSSLITEYNLDPSGGSPGGAVASMFVPSQCNFCAVIDPN